MYARNQRKKKREEEKTTMKQNQEEEQNRSIPLFLPVYSTVYKRNVDQQIDA